jgi:hypothetical protein
LTTLAGRSTTSPAAIWLATWSGSNLIRFMVVAALNRYIVKTLKRQPARRLVEEKGNVRSLRCSG